MAAITLAQARIIVDAAFEGAARRGLATFIAAVADAGGAPKAMLRSDQAGPASVEIAAAKIHTALGFRRSTLSMATYRENAAVNTTLSAILTGRFMPMGGGVVVVDGQGEVVGAAACSGAAAEIDHEIVVEAVRAAGLSVLD